MTRDTKPDQHVPDNVDVESVDRSLVHGIAWTSAVRWSTQLLSWATTLIVARLLDPADYGLVNMALVYLGLVQLINELGLGVAIIQKRDLDTARIAKLGGFSILVGIGFFTLSALIATPYAWFFEEPAVRGIVIVLSLDFVINGVLVVPRSVLTKQLAFNKVAWIDGVSVLIHVFTTLTLAWSGFGYWALVWGPIAGRGGATLFALALCPHRFAWPRRIHDIVREIAFGTRIVVAQVTWYIYSNADFLVVGRVFGKDVLGFYTMAWFIASVPVERITVLLLQVTLGVFSAVQDDKSVLRRYLRNLTAGISYLSFPASVGLALVTDQFVLVVLGAKWEAAIMPMRILALYAGFRTITALFSQLLIATGHERRNMHFNIFASLIFPVIFVAGSKWGTTGVALGWAVGYPLVVIPFFMRYTLKVIDMPAREFLGSIWPALSSTAMMAIAVLISRALIPDTVPLAGRFAINIAAGALAYVGFLLTVHRPRMLAAVRFFKQVRAQQS